MDCIQFASPFNWGSRAVHPRIFVWGSASGAGRGSPLSRPTSKIAIHQPYPSPDNQPLEKTLLTLHQLNDLD
jgi:hypothetical protein